MIISATDGHVFLNETHELFGTQQIDKYTINIRFDRCIFRITINGHKYWLVDNQPGFNRIEINDDFSTNSDWLTNSYIIVRPDNMCEIRKQEKNVIIAPCASNMVRIGDDEQFLLYDEKFITPGIMQRDSLNPPIIFDPSESGEIKIYRKNIAIDDLQITINQSSVYFINFHPLSVSLYPVDVPVIYDGHNLVYANDPGFIVGYGKPCELRDICSGTCSEEYMCIINRQYTIPNTSACIPGKKYYMNFNPSRLTAANN